MEIGKMAGIILLIVSIGVSVQASLIAYEGFRTTVSADDYAAGALSGQNPVLGNSGFSGTYVWQGTTGTMAVETGSQSHSALVRSAQSGQAILKGYTTGRGASRSQAVDPTVSATYYMSGLVNLNSSGRLNAGEYRAAGFMGLVVSGATVSIADGMHYGVRNDSGSYYLAAFAGGNIYNVAALPAFATTYQIVLRLDVNEVGNETLSAWYAASDDAELMEGFSGVSVETWNGASDLCRLTVQTSGGTSTLETWFDEVYLGTELVDVTSIAVPEPATLGLFAISSMALLLWRRVIAH